MANNATQKREGMSKTHPLPFEKYRQRDKISFGFVDSIGTFYVEYQ